MTVLSRDYEGKLGRVDALRRMYRHEQALSELDALDVSHRTGTDDDLRQRQRVPPRQSRINSTRDDDWAAMPPAAVGLRIRILRGLHRLDTAFQILQQFPVELDDVILRENRIAVLDRMNKIETVRDLRTGPSQRVLEDADRQAHHRVGVALARFDAGHSDLDGACRALEAICENDSEDTDAIAYGWWLHFMLRRGDVRRAQDKALELVDHRSFTHRVTAAHVLSRLELSDRARVVLREITESHPHYSGAWRRRLSTLRNVGAFDEAAAVLDEIGHIDIDLPAAEPDGPAMRLPLISHPHLRIEHVLLMHAQFDGHDMSSMRVAEDVAQQLVEDAPHCLDVWWVTALTLRTTSGPAAIRDLAARAPSAARPNILVEYGHALADRSDWTSSQAAYTEALVAQPSHREAHLGLVSGLARQTLPAPGAAGRPLDDAVENCRTCLRDDAVMMSLAAERLAQNGHYDSAVSMFNQTIDHFPQHDLALAGLIRTHGWSRAFSNVPTPMKPLNGEDQLEAPVVVLARGMLDADRGRTLAAHKTFRNLYNRVKASDDEGRRETTAFVALWLATSLRWLYEHDEAQKVVEDALSVPAGADGYFRQRADLHDELGWNWFDRHNYATSVDCFREALRVSPRHLGALRGMIQSYRALGLPRKARAWARRGMTLHPQDADMRCEIAWLYGEMNKFSKARATLAEALNREVAHPAALEWRIVYLCRQGWYEEAEVAAREARERRPESATLAEAICSVPLQKRDWRRALGTADQLRTGRPDDTKFLLVRAAIQDQISTSAHAPDDLLITNDALDALAGPEFSDCPDAVSMRIRMLRRRHETDAARAVLAALSPEMSRLPDIIAEAAEVNLMDADTTVAAFDQLTTLHNRLPWSPRFTRHYAIALASYDRLDAALEAVRDAVTLAETAGEPTPVELLCLYGELLIRANLYPAALAIAQRAVRHPTNHVLEANLLLIDAKAAAGAVDEAYELASKLRCQRPASRRAQLVFARTLEYIGRGPEAANSLGTVSVPLATDRSFVLLASGLRRSVGDYDMAREIVEAASWLMPNSAGIQSAYAWALFELGDVPAAQRTFAELDSTDHPRQDRALGLSGVAWCKVSQATYSQLQDEAFRTELTDAVEEACTLDYAVTETNILAATVHRLLANVAPDTATRRSRLFKALHYAHRALDISDVAICHRLVGRILYELRDIAGAHEHFEASIRLHPYQGDYAGLGLVRLSQGDHDGAITVLEQGIARLTGGKAATPTSDPHVDLYATLGAVHLDRDLRQGICGDNTRIAMQYLRQAVEAEPQHLFAVHNYAIALSHSGAFVDAERLIGRTLANTDPTRSPGGRPWSRLNTVLRRRQPSLEVAAWADREDICALQLRLADMLRGRENMAGGLVARIRRYWLVRRARTYRKDAVISPRARATPRRSARDRRLAVAGVAITTTSVAVAAALWIAWASHTHPSPHLSLLDMLGLTVGFALGAITGLRLPSVSNIKLGAFEITYTDKTTTAVGVLDLPTRAAHPLGFGRLDTVGSQWTARWSSETRLPRLGPNAAGLINGYYSNRDQVLPWRRR